MIYRNKHYNNNYTDIEIEKVTVKPVDLEAVCLAGDNVLEMCGDEGYKIPLYVERNHAGEPILGKYCVNNGIIAFVNDEGKLHITYFTEEARDTLKDAGYEKENMNVPYTNGEAGDFMEEVYAHIDKHEGKGK